MKVVLFGSTGQIGSSLYDLLSPYCDLFTDRDDNTKLRLQSKIEVQNFLNKYPADLYINAAAYTDVDSAENNRNECLDINTKFVEQLVLFLKKYNRTLIHFSTDYVYGQKNFDYLKENTKCYPLNYYGKTKKLAEEKIVQELNNYFIFRISWIYSHIRKNFYKTMKNLFLKNTEIDIVDDQWGAPTPAFFIAENVLQLIKHNKLHKDTSGIYNLAPSDYTNWYGFASKILDYHQNKIPNKIYLNPIKTEKYQTIATRQKNSKLDCTKFINTFNLQIPHWEYLFNEHEKRNFEK